MPLKLLIADDSVTIRKVVDLAFEDEDVKLLTAGDGQEALDKANEVQPDIIIADTDMPKLNGFELCRKIKEDEKLKKIAVCLLHSDFEEFDEAKFFSCGADGHLSKPFKSEDIINKVAEMTGSNSRNNIDEKALNDDILVKDNSQDMELPEDLDDLEILPLDEVEKEIQNEEGIELKPEDEISGQMQDEGEIPEKDSIHDSSEDEISEFMDDIEGSGEMVEENKSDESMIEPSAESEKVSDNETKKELDEFNKALNIPDEDMGEAEPYIEEGLKNSDQPKLEEEIKSTEAESDEKAKIEELEKSLAEEVFSGQEELHKDFQQDNSEPDKEQASELEPMSADIKEENEDLIENAGILHDKTFEEQDVKEISTKTSSAEGKQFMEDDFEKLIGGYIKQVIEKILKEAIQNEIAGITDKIIEAVERIAREITPDISKTIIQKEIQKLKNSQ